MIIKRRYTKSFVTLENALVRDRRLSLDEHGMLHYLLSLPDDWEVSRSHCAKFWNIGRDKAARIFRSLRKCGWAQVERVHGEDGTFLGVRWVITDEPGEEIAEAALDQENDVDDDTPDAADASPAEPEETEAPAAAEPLPEGNHDTPYPYDGSPVTRVTHTPEKAYHGLYIDSKKTDSEENRLPQNGAGENSLGVSEKPLATFTDLAKLWPIDHVLSRVAAEQAWQRFGKVQRQQAYDVAPRYLDDCRRSGRKVCDLTTYLRESRFDRFVKSPKLGATFHAKAGSAQWHRWREYFAATGKPVAFMEMQASKGVGWTVPHEWPPAVPPRPKATTDPQPLLPELSEQDAAEFR